MSKDDKSKAYAKYSTLGIQMGVIIGLFTWLGVYLDGKYPNKYSLYTLCLALFGVFIAMFIMIKEVIKMGKDNEK
jgi:ATP synthase protein I